MAHELTINRFNKAEMAYTGELPWHGLGQEVTKGAPLEVWRREAGLNWEAVEAKARYTTEDGMLLDHDGYKVLYRSDTFKPVGMVSNKYEPVQPAAVLEFFRDMTEVGDWHIHTAGSMRGGSKIWAMATHDIRGAVKGFDGVEAHLLLATSLDGSMKTTAKLTSVRVVCANTLAIALGDKGASVQVSHRSIFDPKSIKQSLGLYEERFGLFMEDAEALASKTINTSDARMVLRSLFGEPKVKTLNPSAPDYEFQRMMAQFAPVADGQKEREQRSVSRCLSLFAGEGMGADLPTAKGTAWGLLNAVTQHVDHEMGRSADTRMESAWFGRGDDIKQKAFDTLVEA